MVDGEANWSQFMEREAVLHVDLPSCIITSVYTSTEMLKSFNVDFSVYFTWQGDN